MLKKMIVTGVCASLLVGCQGGTGVTGGTKQTGGAVLGGIGGAVIGSSFGKGSDRIIGATIGTLAGAWLGSEIGRQMDERDKLLADRTAKRALEHNPDRRSSTWRNPNTNHSGEFVVKNTQENFDNRKVCRDYVHTVNIDGEKQKVHGRACRHMDDQKGDWIVQ